MDTKNKITFKRKLLDSLRKLFQNRLCELILIKILSNREYGSFITKIVPNHYQYSKNTFRFVERNQINYKLDLSDIIDWFIYFNFSESSKSKLFNLANEGDTVIDIGSNVGEVSMNLAIQVGSFGSVHSFEPHPINIARFKNNLARNKFKNIHLNEKALGNKNGIFQLLIVDENNYGRNRIAEINKDTSSSFEDVEVVLFDDYATERKLNKISLIKIDVEGFEMNVLNGAQATLRKCQPILFIEVDDNNLKLQNSSAVELIQFLENLDYSFYFADNVKEIPEDYDYLNCHFDLIAKNKLT